MGCCCSTRPDPTIEKGLSSMSTKSLRSEIDSNTSIPEAPIRRKKTKRMPQLSARHTSNWSSQPSSPRGRSRLSTLKAVSTKTSRANSPKSLSFKNFSQNFLKESIRINYTTVRKLHKGFYGEISLANDKRTEIKKVIKEFKKSVIPENIHEKFIMEIQKFQCLDHPNVVKLLEVYDTRESWLLVYEFFSGSSLLDKANEIIGNSLACSIMQDILWLLKY
ncbi:unnamed protein product [Blepharisma stoltei]|uniref:Protein kinase domain-containing protein n=1 Tax=Blepharisma stoltei TaxID=1481888 RepID=A0AAU9ISZ2_9CILI|nr:unnamed protein product [Blepharisma stoltei]